MLTASAAKIGGLEGAREIAQGAGIEISASTLPAGDRGWSAKQLLIASAIPETLITHGQRSRDR